MYGGTYAIIIVHATHMYCGLSWVGWVSHFSLENVSLLLETGAKNVLKSNHALWFLFSIQFSDYGATLLTM